MTIVEFGDLECPYCQAAAPILRELVDTSAVLAEDGVDLRDHLAAIEISLIRQAMELAGGVVAQAAKLLRLQRTTLVEKLRKYDLADVGAPSSVS